MSPYTSDKIFAGSMPELYEPQPFSRKFNLTAACLFCNYYAREVIYDCHK